MTPDEIRAMLARVKAAAEDAPYGNEELDRYRRATYPTTILALIAAVEAVMGERGGGAMPRTCLRCRQTFENEYDIYRCVDCGAELHRECAKQHFGERVWPPTQACAVDVALREERARNEHFQQLLKQADVVNARLREALVWAQWHTTGDEARCGYCGEHRDNGHAAGCWITEALTPIPPAPEGTV